MQLMRTKPVEQSMQDTEEPEHQLKRELSALDPTVFGIGVIIGTGIFVLSDLPRPFRTPLVPFVPIPSILAYAWLMLNLPIDTWLRFLAWTAIGFLIYFAYGYRHSGVGRSSGTFGRPVVR